ncbi:branched-chain amino acid transaminase [soil metagenome]
MATQPESSMLDWAYFQGEIVPFSEANFSIGTHVVQYGTGVFAGIRAYLSADGENLNVFRLEDHAKRLLSSARLLRSETTHTVESVSKIILDLLAKNAPTGDTYIRPFFYKPAVTLTPRLRGIGDELAVYMLPLGDYLPTSGVKAIVSSWVRVPDNAIPSRGKITGAYINSAFAKDEAEEKGADDAILLNTAGKVSEGSSCNLFIVRNNTLITPPISSDILEGITRRTVFELANDLNLEVETRTIDRSELYVADEAFFCGTGVQVAPIASIDGRPVGEVPGPLTKQISDRFFNMMRGNLPEYFRYLSPVKVRVATPAD